MHDDMMCKAILYIPLVIRELAKVTEIMVLTFVESQFALSSVSRGFRQPTVIVIFVNSNIVAVALYVIGIFTWMILGKKVKSKLLKRNTEFKTLSRFHQMECMHSNSTKNNLLSVEDFKGNSISQEYTPLLSP